jgi:PhnB protein
MSEHPLIEQLDQIIDAVLAGGTLASEVEPELASLAEIAGLLQHLPSENFKARLKTELERSAPMKAEVETRTTFRTVSPFIIHRRAPELVEFLKRTFDAEELERRTNEEAYGFYAEVRIGSSLLMLGGGSAAGRGNLPGAFHVYVDDCDATYRRALDAGAVALMGAVGAPTDRPYGERSAFVEDSFGNYWYIATSITAGDEHPKADLGSVVPFLHPESARKYITFLKAAFGAEEMAVLEYGGRVMHAAVRIGDAVLEMGEPENRAGIPSGGFFVRVDDVQAAYARALVAGATVVRPPEDIPYGYQSAIVKDIEGFMWWTARLMRR